MDICCRRACGFFVFLFFGIVCVVISYKISLDNNNQTPFHVTIILYSILLSTSIRYKKYISKCQRSFSAFAILVGYIVYWAYLFTIKQDLGDDNIYILMGSSVITAMSDMLVFTSYFYDTENTQYGLISNQVQIVV